MSEPIKPKWNTIDSTDALQLTAATNSQGVVYPVASALPEQIRPCFPNKVRRTL